MKIEKVRKWLKNNKVFFETIMTFLLSSMALIVSVQSCNTYKLQTQIALLQAMPRFDIALCQKYDETKQKYTTNEINIYNQSGFFTNFDSSDVVILKVNYMDEEYIEKNLELFVDGYFKAQFVSPSSQGLLRQFTGNDNNSKYLDLKLGLINYSKSHGLEYALLDVKQYIRIIYKDILGKEHIEYYYVPFVGAANTIDKSQGEKLFNGYHEAIKGNIAIDFDKLTVEQIVEKLKQS